MRRNGSTDTLLRTGGIRDDPKDVLGELLDVRSENLGLKKTVNEQQEKSRKLLTKFTRLSEELKKARSNPGARGAQSVHSRRDVESENMLEDLRSQMADLARANSGLKSKLSYFKSLQEAQTRKRTPYDHVRPRIESGVPTSRRLVPATSTRRGTSSNRGFTGNHRFDASSNLPPDEDEIKKLEELVNMLREKLIHSEEEQARLAGEVAHLQEGNQSDTLKADIEHVTLQRELAEKTRRLTEIQIKHDKSEETMKRMVTLDEEKSRTIKELSEELKKERLKTVELEHKQHSWINLSSKVAELEEIISDLRSEKSLLEAEQARLLESAFKTSPKDDRYKKEVDKLKADIKVLEEEKEKWLVEKKNLLARVDEGNEKLILSQLELQTMGAKYRDLGAEHKLIQEKLSYFRKADGTIDSDMIEEAIALLKVHRQKQIGLEYLLNIDETYEEKKLLQQLRIEQAECVQELEKIRKLLLIQEQINKDYKREVTELKRRLNQQANDYESQIEDSSRLLDVRATKIAKLEAQLRNIAYGSQKVVSNGTYKDDDDGIVLENGENLIELTFSQAFVNADGLRLLKNASENDETQLTTFVAFDFYDFETHCTSLGLGTRPRYNHQAQFRVFADDFFLHCCETKSVELLLMQCSGVEFALVGKCMLSLKEIIDPNFSGRSDYVLNLIHEQDQCTVIGTIQVCLGIRLPMQQVVKAFRERAAAISSI